MSYIGQQLPADVFSGFVTDSFTGDGSATTFTLSKAPFSEDALIVVINNVIQKPVTNFTVSGTTLTIVGDAVASGDVIYAMHTSGVLPITTASKLDATTACTITTSDNTDTLSLISTDADANSGPNLRLYRNSGSPAVGDNLGQIDFEGRNDNSEDVVYASMMARARDETDGTEDGGFQLDIMQGGTLRSLMKYYSDGAAQELSFNDDSIDVDFRVESDGSTHQLFVDAGNGRVGIGTSSPDYTLHVRSTGSPSNDTFIDIEGNAADANCGIQFTDSGGNLQGRISYDTDDDNLQFTVNGGSEAMRINSAGRLLIGHTSVDLASVVSVRVSTDDALITADNAKADVQGYMIRSAADRGATLYYAFYDALSGNAADREFYVRGDGNVYADGSFSGSGADYAEFFESKTGNAIAVGTTVVLEDNKVRASTDSDEASSIIGVVRPKSDTMIKASMVIGNCAWNHWSGKYLTDDYDSFITEEFTITEWTETTYEDGNSKTEEVWYETDKIPSDVTVPTEDVKDSDGRVIKTKAVVKTTEADGVNKLIRKKENPSFDKTKEYSPREKRDEWVIIGLLGQVPINKGQKTGDRWIKMRDKSDTVEEWYIR